MKNKLIAISLISTLLLTLGCSRHTTPIRTVQKDSIKIETVVEHIEKVRFDTVYIPIPVESSRNDKVSESYLETSLAESTAKVNDDGTLTHNLKNKPQKVPVSVPVVDTKVTDKEKEYITQIETKEIPVKLPLTNLQKFLMLSGLGAWLVLLAICAVRVYRIIK